MRDVRGPPQRLWNMGFCEFFRGGGGCLEIAGHPRLTARVGGMARRRAPIFGEYEISRRIRAKRGCAHILINDILYLDKQAKADDPARRRQDK